MTKKIFRSFMLSAVAVLLAGVVIVMTCLYSYFASVQESQLQDQPRHRFLGEPFILFFLFCQSCIVHVP